MSRAVKENLSLSKSGIGKWDKEDQEVAKKKNCAFPDTESPCLLYDRKKLTKE